jgi:L,D-transpeptidase YcbB
VRRRTVCLVCFVALLLPAAARSAEVVSWFDAGRPTAQAHEAVELLSSADSHGLRPSDYDAPDLAARLHRVRQGEVRDASVLAQLDRHLTAAMVRYLDDLHQGRIGELQLPSNNGLPPRAPFDSVAYLRAAVAAGRLRAAAQEAAPRFVQYEHLRTALARYGELGDHPAWWRALPPLPVGPTRGPAKLEPGQPYAGVALLRERLIALGDLAPVATDSMIYEGALVDALRSFQARHGLTDDGVIGKATLAQLDVTPAARHRQISLTLERLRWTPLLDAPRMVVINLPEFVLRAYEVQDGQIVVRETMKVIVGKALDTRTPLFGEQMRYIEFSPFWNVPPSIARDEVVPQLRRDAGYFDREGFEFVTREGAVVTGLSSEMLDAVLAGNARIRQRPGPRNALGGIKFVFPNRDHIYLHHTPSVRLFERDRRDLSHGCIRLERPLALATFVLQDMPHWTEARVRQAMAAGAASTVRLTQPLPVLITYGTALVKQGRIHFFDDIYSHDRQLDARLRQPRAPLRPSMSTPNG